MSDFRGMPTPSRTKTHLNAAYLSPIVPKNFPRSGWQSRGAGGVRSAGRGSRSDGFGLAEFLPKGRLGLTLIYSQSTLSDVDRAKASWEKKSMKKAAEDETLKTLPNPQTDRAQPILAS